MYTCYHVNMVVRVGAVHQREREAKKGRPLLPLPPGEGWGEGEIRRELLLADARAISGPSPQADAKGHRQRMEK